MIFESLGEGVKGKISVLNVAFIQTELHVGLVGYLLRRPPTSHIPAYLSFPRRPHRSSETSTKQNPREMRALTHAVRVATRAGKVSRPLCCTESHKVEMPCFSGWTFLPFWRFEPRHLPSGLLAQLASRTPVCTALNNRQPLLFAGLQGRIPFAHAVSRHVIRRPPSADQV